MADHLMKSILARRFSWISVAAALFACPVLADDLLDPTRPPAAVSTPSDTPIVEVMKPAGLQSVIVSKNRSSAIIDGQTIELGGKYGDVRLIEVSDTGVILQGASGRRVLTLFPGVSISKKTVKARP